jgi:hypothetical protein
MPTSSSRSPMLTEHQWGPHRDGIRWAQCQVCLCLRHDPEAKGECPGPEAVAARQRDDRRKMARDIAKVARKESGY